MASRPRRVCALLCSERLRGNGEAVGRVDVFATPDAGWVKEVLGGGGEGEEAAGGRRMAGGGADPSKAGRSERREREEGRQLPGGWSSWCTAAKVGVQDSVEGGGVDAGQDVVDLTVEEDESSKPRVGTPATGVQSTEGAHVPPGQVKGDVQNSVQDRGQDVVNLVLEDDESGEHLENPPQNRSTYQRAGSEPAAQQHQSEPGLETSVERCVQRPGTFPDAQRSEGLKTREPSADPMVSPTTPAAGITQQGSANTPGAPPQNTLGALVISTQQVSPGCTSHPTPPSPQARQQDDNPASVLEAATPSSQTAGLAAISSPPQAPCTSPCLAAPQGSWDSGRGRVAAMPLPPAFVAGGQCGQWTTWNSADGSGGQPVPTMTLGTSVKGLGGVAAGLPIVAWQTLGGSGQQLHSGAPSQPAETPGSFMTQNPALHEPHPFEVGAPVHSRRESMEHSANVSVADHPVDCMAPLCASSGGEVWVLGQPGSLPRHLPHSCGQGQTLSDIQQQAWMEGRLSDGSTCEAHPLTEGVPLSKVADSGGTATAKGSRRRSEGPPQNGSGIAQESVQKHSSWESPLGIEAPLAGVGQRRPNATPHVQHPIIPGGNRRLHSASMPERPKSGSPRTRTNGRMRKIEGDIICTDALGCPQRRVGVSGDDLQSHSGARRGMKSGKGVDRLAVFWLKDDDYGWALTEELDVGLRRHCA
eukprot:evm.model.scf_515.8 EVM.evm.TU.scf_515.8   scf_515:64710-69758(-)